jgi:hypothetical protein
MIPPIPREFTTLFLRPILPAFFEGALYVDLSVNAVVGLGEQGLVAPDRTLRSF